MASDEVWQKFKEELRAKSDIVSIISRYVPLVQKGRSFWGRCPFHNEKTPSFTVNPYDKVYHCFGCGAGGDVIKFVKDIESIDYHSAVNMLAEMAQMEVPTSRSSLDDAKIKKQKAERDRLLALLKETAMHYVENLKLPHSKAGIFYLEKRKITPEIARKFGIGFGIGYKDTIRYLISKGYSIEEMEKAGVIKYRDEKPYDAMGNRVVFPILDVSSNVVAFCGRTLEAKPNFAKYLNTQDTICFSKSKNLYAINLVKKAKLSGVKIDSLIVVEGQMDVVSLHKAGFVNAVASMGTSLTQDQAKLIKRFVDKVYICYDGDTAGKKATLRGLDILRSNGLEVFVMSMPEGLDPDDVINKYGAEGYQKLIDKALPLIDFKLEFLAKLYDVKTNVGKSKYLNEAIEVLKSLSDIEREVYMDKVQEISGIMKDFIKRQISNNNKNSNSNEKSNSISSQMTYVESSKLQQKPKKPIDSKLVQAEKFVLSALLHRRNYAFFREDAEKYFTENRKKYYRIISEIQNETSQNDISAIFFNRCCDNISSDEDNSEIQEEVTGIMNYMIKSGDEENELAFYKDCLYLMIKNYAEEEISKLQTQLAGEIDVQKREEILKQISELMKKIQTKKVDI